VGPRRRSEEKNAQLLPGLLKSIEIEILLGIRLNLRFLSSEGRSRVLTVI
jgi:hypothetical protein